MKQNNYGEMIFNENDVLDQLMQGRDIDSLKNMLVDDTVNIEQIVTFVEHFPTTFIPYTFTVDSDKSIPDWDYENQQTWYMPQS